MKVGVLGGTFNPIHLGHLHIARNTQQLFSLEQVHFVVATMPPHKRPEDLIPFTHRYAMVSMAVSETPSFIPSLIELEPEASPYSYDTMKKLAYNVKPQKGILYFIAGGDSLLEIHLWRESEKLLRTYNFIFVMRPGTKPIVLGDVLPARIVPRVTDLTGLSRTQARRRIETEDAKTSRIYLVDAGAPDISATKIRKQISLGKSIRREVPGAVREYIRKLQLYGGR